MTTTPAGTGPILIGYDGSADAEHAITTLAAVAPGAPVTILYAYESLQTLITHQWVMGATQSALDLADREEHSSAQNIVESGAQLATAAGLRPQTQVVRGEAPVWATILSVADDLDASLIVAGSRGRHGLATVLLGDVAHALAQHAHRPVLLVPSPALGAARTTARTAASALAPS